MKETWLQRSSTRLFGSLVSDMPLHEFRILLSCGQKNPVVYVYDHVERSALVFPPGGIPWLLEYFPRCHHPRHVLQRKGKQT